MLTYNFQRIFKARGIERPYSYLVNAGFSTEYASKINQKQVKRMDLREMEKFCILMRCTPNDLFEWTAEAEKQVDADHPINQIKKTDKAVDLIKTLSNVPLAHLPAIEDKIKEELGKLEG
ncbi:MAG: helix-turn-helix transcriptional regulator [Bacteroidales bacterium]|nr:helix-turn-helix transcriptional regulator [Bacteroidales bacterium]